MYFIHDGRVTFWANGKDVIKVEAGYFGEAGEEHDEFYFRDGRLVFVFANVIDHEPILDEQGDSTTTYDESKVANRETLRLYVDKGRVVRAVDKGHVSSVDTRDKGRIKDLLHAAEVFRRAAFSKQQLSGADLQ